MGWDGRGYRDPMGKMGGCLWRAIGTLWEGTGRAIETP